MPNYRMHSGFGGLEVAYWPLEPKFAGSNPARTRRNFQVKKYYPQQAFLSERK
jgi:hypothetical protein